jgi:RNA polymerase subunit RPABC4/transcription elongation factor Spt4
MNDIIKCKQCGLINPSSEDVCERCGASLAEESNLPATDDSSFTANTIPLISCPACGRQVSSQAVSCLGCGQPISNSPDINPGGQPTKDITSVLSSDMNKQVLAAIGSGVLFVGVFMPIYSAPIIGSINYYQNDNWFGMLIIFMAILSVIAMFIKQFWTLLVMGLVSLGALIITFINFQSKMSALQARSRGQIESAVLNTIQLQWGWAVLVVGALILIVVGISELKLRRP